MDLGSCVIKTPDRTRRLVVLIPESIREQRQGLGDISDLGKVDGMLFCYPDQRLQAFWPGGIKFKVDAHFFDNRQRWMVSKRFAPGTDEVFRCIAQYVLEVPSGKLPLDEGARIVSIN